MSAGSGADSVVFAMLCTAIIMVPIAKAKLLTRLKNAPGDIASTASGEAGRWLARVAST